MSSPNEFASQFGHRTERSNFYIDLHQFAELTPAPFFYKTWGRSKDKIGRPVST